jgi:hypothetical protein
MQKIDFFSAYKIIIWNRYLFLENEQSFVEAIVDVPLQICKLRGTEFVECDEGCIPLCERAD